jgi:IgGFc binding protein
MVNSVDRRNSSSKIREFAYSRHCQSVFMRRAKCHIRKCLCIDIRIPMITAPSKWVSVYGMTLLTLICLSQFPPVIRTVNRPCSDDNKISIISTRRLSVQFFSSEDSFLILPTHLLGTEYVAVGEEDYVQYPSVIMAVANEDNTTVGKMPTSLCPTVC